MGDGFLPNFSLTSVNGVLTWIRRRIFIKVCVTVDQIELKEIDPAARVHRRSGAMGTLLLDRRERRPTRDHRHQNEGKCMT
jgi:hypothetical protein